MARDGDATQKSPEAFRTISEVSQALNVPQHVLRFWETRFSQIRPLKRGGNRRYYRPEDISLLRAISYLLYVDGYTIKGVQKLLRENGIRATVSDVMMRSGLEEELGESEVLDLTGGLNPQDAEEAEKAATGEDEAKVAELVMEEEVSVAEIAQEPAAASKAAPAAPPAGKGPIAAPVMAAASGASEEDMPEAADRQRVESLVDELKAIRALLDQASAGT